MSAEFPRMFLCNRLNQGKSSHAISFVPWLLTHSLNSSGNVTLNASCSIQRQYILFNEQRTHDWEDMHAIAYPNLIYKNNQIRKMEYTQTVHKYIFNNPQTQNVNVSMEPICSISTSQTIVFVLS